MARKQAEETESEKDYSDWEREEKQDKRKKPNRGESRPDKYSNRWDS